MKNLFKIWSKNSSALVSFNIRRDLLSSPEAEEGREKIVCFTSEIEKDLGEYEVLRAVVR